ncbi:hypothetical protein L6164_007725 [Bauhinia variegata]|uniref:Uncharacterized protein n=1 Tax=Bauhinia variegata TaxID=167791 RepID=A0ACB9PHA9_BAUVA|nr:hypothetical protein L6164_007725 [Bauhinia variegata]
MPRLSPHTVLRRGFKAIGDLELHKVLQAEINYELMNKDYEQKHHHGSSGDFRVDWDSPYTRDLVLQRKCKSGEEIAVSAIPSPGIVYEFPRKAFMKVCVKKPALSSILQFDCEAFGKDDDSGSDYKIRNAYYLQSPESLSPSIYRGPTFR